MAKVDDGGNWRVQVSLKVGPHLANIRAVNVAEFDALAREAEQSEYLAPFFGRPAAGDAPAPAATAQPAGQPGPSPEEIAKLAVAAAQNKGMKVETPTPAAEGVEPGPAVAAGDSAATADEPLPEAEAVAALKEQLGATEATEEEAPAVESAPAAVDPLELARARMKEGQ